MPRPREFDEHAAVAGAARVFTARGYEGASVDDLVGALGIHRGSLYRTFGSKLQLFHRALVDHVDRELLPWIAATRTPALDGPDPGLLLVAAVERARDPVVAAQVTRVTTALAHASGTDGPLADGLAAATLGLWLAARAGADRTTLEAAAAALVVTAEGDS